MIESGQVLKGSLSIFMTVFVVACVLTLLLLAAARCLAVMRRADPARSDPGPGDELGLERFWAGGSTEWRSGGGGRCAVAARRPVGGDGGVEPRRRNSATASRGDRLLRGRRLGEPD